MPLERPLHTLRDSYAQVLRRIEAPLEAVQATTSLYVRQLDPLWLKQASSPREEPA